MTGSFYIKLDEHEFEILREQARRELRGVREQATLHILRGLNIVDGNSKLTDRKEGDYVQTLQPA